MDSPLPSSNSEYAKAKHRVRIGLPYPTNNQAKLAWCHGSSSIAGPLDPTFVISLGEGSAAGLLVSTPSLLGPDSAINSTHATYTQTYKTSKSFICLPTPLQMLVHPRAHPANKQSLPTRLGIKLPTCYHGSLSVQS